MSLNRKEITIRTVNKCRHLLFVDVFCHRTISDTYMVIAFVAGTVWQHTLYAAQATSVINLELAPAQFLFQKV
jgi:hypothetical protein